MAPSRDRFRAGPPEQAPPAQADETLTGRPPDVDTDVDMPPFPFQDDDFSEASDAGWRSRLWATVKRRLRC